VAATANGGLHTVRFASSFFEPLAQQISRCVCVLLRRSLDTLAHRLGLTPLFRFPVEERTAEERKLEKLVYDRDLNEAFKLGVQLADKYHTDKEYAATTSQARTASM
jgi:hypothetical protein